MLSAIRKAKKRTPGNPVNRFIGGNAFRPKEVFVTASSPNVPRIFKVKNISDHEKSRHTKHLMPHGPSRNRGRQTG